MNPNKQTAAAIYCQQILHFAFHRLSEQFPGAFFEQAG